MEGTLSQYPPGDPKMIDTIVHQLKSQGIFDQFRKECIADVDTKPAYQNLHQRVEGSVTGFLANQIWRPDMNKNLLRDSLRKHIHESGFLDIGVERIVDQVVNPKVLTVFVPKVEDVVYGHLGIEKPKKTVDMQFSKPSTFNFNIDHSEVKKEIALTDLLPKDLDPVSPESDIIKKEDNSADEGDLMDDRDEEESPPFKPLRNINDNSDGSSLSGISGLTSPDSRHSPLSFNGITKEQPLTPCFSPILFQQNDEVTKNVTNSSLCQDETTDLLKEPQQDIDGTEEAKITHVTNEEGKKTPAGAEAVVSDVLESVVDDHDGNSSCTSSRPSSSASDSTSSCSSSSSDSSESPQPEPLEDIKMNQVGDDTTPKKIVLIVGKNESTEEKVVKKEKQDQSNKDEKQKKVMAPIIKDKKEEKQEKTESRHDKDDKQAKRNEHDEQHKKAEKEVKAVKKIDKEKKIIKKDSKSSKKGSKEVSASKYWEKEEKLFSIFDQGETTLKRITKDGKVIREEKIVKKEDKSVHHLEKDTTIIIKDEKQVSSKSVIKDSKDGKNLKIDKVEKILHKNEETKLSSKEDIKKAAKKDSKEEKLVKKRGDDKLDKSLKKDDKALKSMEKDTKLFKKEGKSESSHQDSKFSDSKNHVSKVIDNARHIHKAHRTSDKERVKVSDKNISKDEKSKGEDKSKNEREEKSKIEDKSKQDKYKSFDKSKSIDKCRQDEKHKIKNGNVDKDKSGKQDNTTKHSSTKDKSHKHGGDKQEVKSDSKSKISSKHKDSKREKAKPTDDHSRHRDKRSDDRGSTDRDSNGNRDRSSSSSRQHSNSSKESGHREKKSGGTGGKTYKGGNNDSSETAEDHSTNTGINDTDSPEYKKPKLEGDPASGEYVCVNNEGKLLLKIKKPKIAANIFEVRKIMQQRRSLAKLEKQRLKEIQRSHDKSILGERPLLRVLSPKPSSSQSTNQSSTMESMEETEISHPTSTSVNVQQALSDVTHSAPLKSSKVSETLVNSSNMPCHVASNVMPNRPHSETDSLSPEIHSRAESIQPVRVKPPVVKKSPLRNVECKVPSPAERIESQTASPLNELECARPESDNDEDEHALHYFETPEINEYDKYFLTFMKGLKDSENLTDIEVSSVNTDDLDNFSDSEYDSCLPFPTDSDNKTSHTKRDPTIICSKTSPLSAGVVIADGTVQLKSKSSFTEISSESNSNLPSDAISKNIKITSAENDDIKSSEGKVVGKFSRKGAVTGSLFNGELGADSKVPVSIRSKAEFAKKVGDNASSIPTVRPQLPEEVDNVGLLKSPIPVGALRRHKASSDNSQKSLGAVQTDMDLTKHSKASPLLGKRGVKQYLKSNIKYPDKDNTTDSESASLPTSGYLLKKKDSYSKSVETLSKSEIMDIVVGGDCNEYGVNIINNNVQNLYEGKNDTDGSNTDGKGSTGKLLEVKDNIVSRLDNIIPTPESRTSGSSSSGSVEPSTEKKRRLGPCRRVGLSRPKSVKPELIVKEEANVAVPPTSEFVMPLSPESDVSASSGDQAKKVIDPVAPKLQDCGPANHGITLRQSTASETPASRGQRYSSEDLYKPRPLFNQQPRRTRGAPLVTSTQGSGPVVGVGMKRRAANISSPGTTPMTKTKR